MSTHKRDHGSSRTRNRHDDASVSGSTSGPASAVFASSRLFSIEDNLAMRVLRIRQLNREREDLRNDQGNRQIQHKKTARGTATRLIAHLNTQIDCLLNQVQDLLLQRAMVQVEMGNTNIGRRAVTNGENINNHSSSSDLAPPPLRIRHGNPRVRGREIDRPRLYELSSTEPLRKLERKILAMRLPPVGSSFSLSSSSSSRRICQPSPPVL
jgi:hypothetical protein